MRYLRLLLVPLAMAILIPWTLFAPARVSRWVDDRPETP